MERMQTHLVATIKGESTDPLTPIQSANRLASGENAYLEKDFEDQLKNYIVQRGREITKEIEEKLTGLVNQKIEKKTTKEEGEVGIDEIFNQDCVLKVEEIISSSYNQIKERGKTHPAERQALLHLANQVSEAVKKILSILIDIRQEISIHIIYMDDWKEKAIEEVKNMFCKAYNEISALFG